MYSSPSRRSALLAEVTHADAKHRVVFEHFEGELPQLQARTDTRLSLRVCVELDSAFDAAAGLSAHKYRRRADGCEHDEREQGAPAAQ